MLFADLHAPYQHKDALAFLAAVKEKYDPTIVYSLGDELDNHAMSFWPKEMALANAPEELKMGKAVMRKLAAIFPVLHCVDSNHTSRMYRAGKRAGIPKELLVSYEEALGVQDFNWTWEQDIIFKIKKNTVKLVHNGGANNYLTSQRHGCSIVSAHCHTKQALIYWQSPLQGRTFAIQLGCLLDPTSDAFNYAIGTQPVQHGCAVIIDGVPNLIEMNMTKSGRWNKKVN